MAGLGGEALREIDVEQIVINGYCDVLRRQPDTKGKERFVRKILTGMSEDQFLQALRSSSEYKRLKPMPNTLTAGTTPGTMIRLNIVNVNTPEKYDELYFGPRTIQLMELPDVANLLKLIVKQGKILDLGCGLGRYFKYFNDCDITGIELSLKAIAATREMYPKAHISQHDLNKGIPFPNEEFDYVYAGELMEHIENPRFLVDEFYRVLKIGGIIIANTPFEAEIPIVEHLWVFGLNDIKNIFSKFTEKSIFRFCVDPMEKWEHFLIVGKKNG